jgi:nitrogen fixation NifU-like protein
MPDLSALYREVVLDHSKRPRNFGTLAEATHSADGDNPLCGDTIHVDLAFDGDAVKDARFHGFGCAIATASASLMTERLKGKTRDEVRMLSEAMHEICTGHPWSDSTSARVEMAELAPRVELGELAVFLGVRRYPLRAKCATLAWRTMRSALDAKGDGSATGE